MKPQREQFSLVAGFGFLSACRGVTSSGEFLTSRGARGIPAFPWLHSPDWPQHKDLDRRWRPTVAAGGVRGGRDGKHTDTVGTISACSLRDKCQAGGGWKGWDWGLSPLAQVPSFQEEALRPRVLLCLQCVPLYVLSHHLCITLRNWCPHFWKNTLRGLRRSSHLSQVTRVSGGSDGIRHGSVWLRSSCFPPCILYLKRVGALAELTLFSLL